MKLIPKHKLALALGLLLPLSGVAQDELPEVAVAEAENGTLGDQFEANTDDSLDPPVNFITTTLDVSEAEVEDASLPWIPERVASFQVTFPEAGDYDVYARVRVGLGAANDDSMFIPNNFGMRDPTVSAFWVLVNQLDQGGSVQPGEEIASNDGTAGSSVWKWFNLSEFVETNTDLEEPLTYTVPEGELTQTFEIGAREDGLYIDKLVFAPSSQVLTVAEITEASGGDAIGDGGGNEGPSGPPLAEGEDKFVGGIYSPTQSLNFTAFFNQVTPENAGKWGSVQNTDNPDDFFWDDLDSAVNLAKDNDFPFRMHVLIWGNQQPSWIADLPTAEQRERIEAWFQALADRYNDDDGGGFDYIEVVNEPLHDPPDDPEDGGYIDALGGEGDTGYDWIITAFELAREYFPETDLMINDFNIVSSDSNTQEYLEIIELLQARNLIDRIGVQGHAFSTRGPSDAMIARLDMLQATGLPIQVTEMDVDGIPADAQSSDGEGYVFTNGGSAASNVSFDAEQDAVIIDPIWGSADQAGNRPKAKADLERNLVNGTFEYTIELTQAQVDAGVQVQAYISSGGDFQFSGFEQVQAGDNTITWTAETDVASATSFGVQLTGPDGAATIDEAGQEDDAVLKEIVVTLPAQEETTVLDFADSAEGFSADGSSGSASVEHNATEQAVELVPDWPNSDTGGNRPKAMGVIGSSLESATIEYVVNVTQAQADAGLQVQPFLQQNSGSFTIGFGGFQSVSAGDNILTLAAGSIDVENAERFGIQLIGDDSTDPPSLEGAEGDPVLIKQVTIARSGGIPESFTVDFGQPATDGPQRDDRHQAKEVRRIFSTFWDHPGVEGITFWGYRTGHWRQEQQAMLVDTSSDGVTDTNKLAMDWLECFFADDQPKVVPNQVIPLPASLEEGEVVDQILDCRGPASSTVVDWEVVGGDGEAIFDVTDEGGITLMPGDPMEFTEEEVFTLDVVAINEDGSESAPERLVLGMGEPQMIPEPEPDPEPEPEPPVSNMPNPDDDPRELEDGGGSSNVLMLALLLLLGTATLARKRQ